MIPIEDNYKYRTFVERLIQLEANDWPKVLGAPEKTTLGQILPITSSATGWEWGEIQNCCPNKNTRRIYHSNKNY